MRLEKTNTTYRREKGPFQIHTGTHEIAQSVPIPQTAKFNPFTTTSIKDIPLQSDNEISIAKTSLLLPFNVFF